METCGDVGVYEYWILLEDLQPSILQLLGEDLQPSSHFTQRVAIEILNISICSILVLIKLFLLLG